MLSGSIAADSQELIQHQLGVLEEDSASVTLKTNEKTEFLILSGEPIDEPLSTYGPFGMNTPQELNEAIRDYQMGKMGTM